MPSEVPPTSKDVRRVLAASVIGTTLEWYDYLIYGTFAALVFNKLFFPAFSPLTGTLAAFATFAVGFLARPLGGIIAGHYGDRVGRKTMMILTVLAMGISTTLIGALPTYASIGVAAPILLVVLRILQGFAIGGELGGSVLLAVEYAPQNRRGFYGSWPSMGAFAGLFLSMAVAIPVTSLPDDQFLAWGWRIPFLASIVLVAIGLFIRTSVTETPAFREVRKTGSEARFPVIEVIRRSPRNVLLAAAAYIPNNASTYIATVFLLSYATKDLGIPRTVYITAVMIGCVFGAAATLFFGAMSDRFGRKPVYLTGVTLVALLTFPLFWLVGGATFVSVAAGLIVYFIAKGAILGPQGAYFAELFGTNVRYSGASLGYNLAAILVGAPTPAIATALLAWSGGAIWPIVLYVVVICLIAGIAVRFAWETAHEPWELRAAEPEATR
ncbi:metabolite-proton symporter [Kibdelosporangium banguiense]|uniref:Metabolite-proton symporter n=1 Tax=Kibdelosporangium banguiense TaxID=1365924 RepID=A0ABS4TXZ3_9PSEU|nr:MFS transporter [Kibdelosporangium banguiense]MBP2329266.1 metabolite-proton symporter [Kibdelosporangium banguiense]